jgi:hypothetical protein
MKAIYAKIVKKANDKFYDVLIVWFSLAILWKLIYNLILIP